MARENYRSLYGDLTKLKGAIDTALIQGGSAATTGLRGMTQAVTATINAYSALPRAIQGSIFGITGITGAALLGAGALIFISKTIREARASLVLLGLTSTRVAAGMAAVRGALTATMAVLGGPWAYVVAAGIGILTAWYLTKKKATKATEEFVSAIQADSGELGANTRAAVANKLEQEGVLKAALALGLSLPKVTDAVLGNGNAYKEINEQLDAHIAALIKKRTYDKDETGIANQIASAQQLQKNLHSLNGTVDASVESAKRQSAATRDTTLKAN